MTRTLTLLSSLAALAVSAAPLPSTAITTQQLRHGLDQASGGHYREAVSELRDFVSRFPEHVYSDYAQFALALSHYRLGEYALAEVTTDYLIFRHPHSFKIDEARGLNSLSRWQRGDRERASEELRQWLVRHPESELAPLIEAALFTPRKKK